MFDHTKLSYPRVEDGVILYGPDDWPKGKLAALYRQQDAPEPKPEEKAKGLDINSADLDQLKGIEGFGKKTAENLIASREQDGPFTSLEDAAERVRGVTVDKLTAAGAVTA